MKKVFGKVFVLVLAITVFAFISIGAFAGTETDKIIYNVPAVQVVPELDGTIESDWADALKVEISYDAFIENGIGTSIFEYNMGDSSIDTATPRAEGDFYMKWSEEGLYFAADITDDSIHIFQPYGAQSNIQDAIQLNFDPANTETQDLNSCYIFDFVSVSDEDHQGPASWYEYFQYAGHDEDAGIEVAGVLTDYGYTIEWFMPWTALQAAGEEFTPEEGYIFGFGLMVVDFNDDAQLNDLYFDFGNRANTIDNPSTWNKILLVK